MAENWREGSMIEQNKHMLESGYLSDCRFLVGEKRDKKEFCCHKNIMSRSSEVFHAMFFGSLCEKDVVRVTDITPDTFQILLYHVYCDTLEVSDVEMSLSVCSAAHKYNLQPLINKCTDYIVEHMTPAYVLQVLHFSDFTDNIQLNNHCTDMLQSRTEEVLSADSWYDVPEQSIITLLQQDSLNIQSELSLVSACQRWAQHQLDINIEDCVSKKVKRKEYPLRNILKPFLPYLRFLSLTAKDFLQITKNKQIFSKRDTLFILQCLLEPAEYKMPEGMCEIKTCRYHSFNANHISRISLVSKLTYITEFNIYTYGYDSKPVTSVPFVINSTIVVYGFAYKSLEYAQQSTLIQSRMPKKRYVENCTVQFVNEEEQCVVAEYKLAGKLQFDSLVKLDFPQPFLAKRSIPYSLKVLFHHQHTDRNYLFFYKSDANLDSNFDIPTHRDGRFIRFPCISKLYYKLATKVPSE